MDPFNWFLKKIHSGFYRKGLKDYEQSFIEKNIKKHRGVLWIDALVVVLTYFGLRDMPNSVISTLVNALIAFAVVFGGAWFAITFAAIPGRLIHISMYITFTMFAAFTSSVIMMFGSVALLIHSVAPSVISELCLDLLLVFIYIAGFIGAVLYDTGDGLKAGLDELQLKQSRAMLMWLKQEYSIEPTGD